MGETTKQVLKTALSLPASERAILVDELISSLDRPDPRIDMLWAMEARDRVEAYRSGEMDAILEEEVYAEFERK
jgi:hypothetical protein